MMEEFTEQISDPEKLKASFAQLKDNPMLAGLADAVPGFKEAMENPDEIAEQVAAAFSKTKDVLAEGGGLAEMMQAMGSNPELMGESLKQAQQMLAGLGGGAGGADGMAQLLASLGGEGGGLGGLEGMLR